MEQAAWAIWSRFPLASTIGPVEDAVFKISYQYQPMAFNPNTEQRIHDNALVISAATYF